MSRPARLTEKRQFTLRNKYRTVAGVLSPLGGSILDVGARDQVLRSYLDLSRVTYASCDLEGTHDFAADLERPLPFTNSQFDHVVALDVLEHVELIHDCFAELARVAARTLTVALPNIAVITKRWTFMTEGHLGGKYRLLPKHQGDRHRWLTIRPEIDAFVLDQAHVHGFRVRHRFEEVVVTRLPRWCDIPIRAASLVALKAGFARWSALTERSVFVLERD